MTDLIEVAGAILPVAGYPHPLVVEADPESEATRSFKNVARFVYRFVQDARWSGDHGAVSIRVRGDGREAAAVAANVGVLLASLVDVAVEADPFALVAFDLSASSEPRPDDHRVTDPTSHLENPRDGLWLVPRQELDSDPVVERFDLTLGRSTERRDDRTDLMLVAVAHATTLMSRPRGPGAVEFAAVLIDAPSPDHPSFIAVAD